MMESYFDCWCDIDGYSSPADFLNSCMSYTHEERKIIVDKANKIDIFEDCLHAYADKSGRQRRFPLNRIVLLYAITSYLRRSESISEDAFVRRLRCINNLIQNSEDEISDRIDRNRIPAILRQVDAIMIDSNNNVSEKLYMFSVMQTKSQWSSNTYMPYLKEADESHLSRDSMGQRLVYGDRHIICRNSEYLLRDNETEEVIKSFPIPQNEDGVDVEDRILLLKRIVPTLVEVEKKTADNE